jgi:FtsZ-binding cell division protein ZapB
MFSNFLNTITLDDLDHNKCLFYDAVSKNYDRVITRLDRHNLNVNAHTDECGQNLLHIAVRTGNHDFIRKLVLRGTDINKRNCFDESPLDVAVQRNDVGTVKLLLNEDTQDIKNEVKYLKTENTRLKDRNNNLEAENERLILTNTDITKKWNSATVQAGVENNSRKRLRADLDVCERENKRLKTENTQLKEDNRVLQETVKSLREKHKK